MNEKQRPTSRAGNMTSSSKLITGSSPINQGCHDIERDPSPAAQLALEIVDDIILGVCFDIHRSIKEGSVTLELLDDEILKQHVSTKVKHLAKTLQDSARPLGSCRILADKLEVVDSDGLDVFGQLPLKKPVECVCPNCQRNMAASRFAPHLEKCMGMGRNSSRIASRRLANTGNLKDDDDDDNLFDDDWTWNLDSRKPGKKNKREKQGNSPRRAKAPKRNGEAGTPRPGTPSSVNSGEIPVIKTGPTLSAFEALSLDEKKALLSQTCGVISEHTGRMCTRSHRCPQHTDDQRKSVRLLLIGQHDIELPVGRMRPDGSGLDPDDVIDVDSYEDGDGQALRDTLNRLTWEEESNVSTGDDNSPAAASIVKKKRKKKAKHKRRPRRSMALPMEPNS